VTSPETVDAFSVCEVTRDDAHDFTVLEKAAGTLALLVEFTQDLRRPPAFFRLSNVACRSV
jgi:hypothetical protein